MATTQVVSGSLWMISLRWSMRLIGIVSLLLLARILSPADYGVVAMAYVFYGLLETVAYAGADLAVLRLKDPTEADYNCAWSIQLLQGIFVSCILAICAVFVPELLHEPRLRGVLLVLATSALIESLQNIGLLDFRRLGDYAGEFRFELIKKLCVFTITLGAALFFKSYWALICGHLTGSIVGLLLSYRMQRYRPRFDLARIKTMWAFSKNLMISRIGQFLNRRIDGLVLGASQGSIQLGTYHVSSELASAPVYEIVMPIRRVLFPLLAESAGDQQRFQKNVNEVLPAVGSLVVGLGFGLHSVSMLLIPFLLGPKWLGAAELVKMLALVGVIAGISLLIEVPLWAKGDTRTSARISWIEAGLLLVLVIPLAYQMGAMGCVYARLIVSLFTLPIYIFVAQKSGVCEVRVFCLALLRALVAGMFMVAILRLLEAALSNIPTWIAIAALVLSGFTIFSIAVFGVWFLIGRPEGFEMIVLAKFREQLNRIRK
jgi:lipopolysaccharide exporter